MGQSCNLINFNVASLAAAAALVLFACGGSEAAVTAGEATCGGNALYALSTNVDSPDGTVSYVLITPTLDEGQLTTSGALEVPGGGVVSSPGAGDSVLLSRYESPLIERYALDASCQLVRRGEVSFAAYGINNLFHRPVFISPTKAYFIDQETLQVIVWNPSAMTVERTFELEGLSYEGLATVLDGKPTRVGNLLYVGAGFANWDVPTVAPEVRALIIDLETDAYTVATDTRTGWLYHSALGADGYVYFSPPAWQGALHRMNPAEPEPAVLRIRAGARSFDPTFVVHPSEKVNGAPAGTLVGGPDGRFLFRALDSAAFEITSETDVNSLSAAAAWRWFDVDLSSTATASPVESGDLTASAGSPETHAVDGQWYANESTADYSTTKLVRTDVAPLRAGIEFPGWANSVVKVR